MDADLEAIIQTACLAVGLYSGSLKFYTALQKGSSQVSGAITATVPAFTAILSIIFLHATLKHSELLLIALITVGLVVVSWPQRRVGFDAGVGYAVAAVLLWAVYFTFISDSIRRLGPYWANYISVVSGTVALLIYRALKRHRGAYSLAIDRPSLYLVAASALFVGGAPLAYNLALEHASPAIVAPIAGSYAPLFIVLSSILFKDKVSPRQWAGICITIAAVLGFILVSNG